MYAIAAPLAAAIVSLLVASIALLISGNNPLDAFEAMWTYVDSKASVVAILNRAGPYYVSALVTLLGPVVSVIGAASHTLDERTIGSGPREGQTVPVAITVLQGDRLMDVTTTSASALLGLIPTLVFFLIFQRTLTRGITAGAVK